jgi:hypothetical protein
MGSKKKMAHEKQSKQTEVKSMQKKCVKVVALGMHTATIEKDTKRG